MKELRNGIKIIGIDHGYGNIKTAGTVTPTGITASSTEPVFAGNILHYDGMYYRMGEGHKEFIPNKVQDNDFYLFTLMAIARELSKYGIREADVHIAAGLPLTCQNTARELPLIPHAKSRGAFHIPRQGVSHSYNRVQRLSTGLHRRC